MNTENFNSKNLIVMKNVNAARKLKNGSPKIREILRQRCRQQMLKRRNDLFMKKRFGLNTYCNDIQDTLRDIVHKEFENIACMESKKFESQEYILFCDDKALALEYEAFEIEEAMEEQWIIEEYEKILWEQKQILSMLIDNVICPICLKHTLREISMFALCDCGLKLPVHEGLQGLKRNIQKQVNIHSAACLDIPKFSVFYESDIISLCFSCKSCDIFTLV